MVLKQCVLSVTQISFSVVKKYSFLSYTVLDPLSIQFSMQIHLSTDFSEEHYS